MQQAELKVLARESGTKSSTRVLRTKGLVPATIYGPGVKNVSCAFQEKEIRKLFNNDFESNFILNLASEATTLNGKKVILKSVERDSVSWKMIHADLYEISFDRPLTVSLPFHFTGVASGVKNSGGILQVIRQTVSIRALPSDIPQFIEVDISGLEVNTSLHIGDIKFDSKIEVLDASLFTVVSVVEPEKEEVAAPVVAAAAEGAAATGAAPAGGAAPAAAADAAKAPAKK